MRAGWRRYGSYLVAGLALSVSLLELAFFPTPEALLRGEPFVYWSYVNQAQRPPWSLVGLVLVAGWIVARQMWGWVRWWRAGAVIVLALAGGMATLLTPLLTASRSAVHLQSAATTTHTYHLYYQNITLLTSECEYVVVECEPSGWRCRYVQRWNLGAICLGTFAPIRLESLPDAEGEQIAVMIENERVLILPEG